MTKSPQFSLRKWTFSDDKDLSLEKENIEKDEKLKENLSSRDSGKSLLYCFKAAYYSETKHSHPCCILISMIHPS